MKDIYTLVRDGKKDEARKEIENMVEGLSLGSRERGDVILSTILSYLDAKNEIMLDYLKELETSLSQLEKLGIMERKAEDVSKIYAIKQSLKK